MSFNNTLSVLENFFSSTDWTNNNIKTYPQNYQGKIDSNEFVRVNVYQGNSSLNFNADSTIFGEIVCNIFVPVGQGMKKANEIADLIDSLISRKTISGVQTTNSYLTTVGVDSNDKGLFRLDITTNYRNYK